MNFFAISDDVMRLSLLTLVYRGAPQVAGAYTTFNQICVDTARAALDRHQDCIAFIRKTDNALFLVYIHW